MNNLDSGSMPGMTTKLTVLCFAVILNLFQNPVKKSLPLCFALIETVN